MLLFYSENLNTLFIKYNIIKNLINREKKNENINNKIETNKNDKIIYKLSYRLFYLISLSTLKYLKKYAKI